MGLNGHRCKNPVGGENSSRPQWPRPLWIAAMALWMCGCVEKYPDLFAPLLLNGQLEDAGAAGALETALPSAAPVVDAGEAPEAARVRSVDAMAPGPFPATAPAAVLSGIPTAVGGRARPTANIPRPAAEASSADAAAPADLPGPAPEAEHFQPYALPLSERPLDDASCPPDCNFYGGTCRAGRCVYDCDADSQCHEEQTYCPPNTQCHVRCGDGSCSGTIVCREGADCTIDCEGRDSCAAGLICEGNCRVTCSGADSCRGGVRGSVEHLMLRCSGHNSCGGITQCEGAECDVQCTGADSCAEVLTHGQTNTVQCLGSNACAAGVWCSGGRCSVDCSQGACAAGFVCQAPGCSQDGY